MVICSKVEFISGSLHMGLLSRLSLEKYSRKFVEMAIPLGQARPLRFPDFLRGLVPKELSPVIRRHTLRRYRQILPSMPPLRDLIIDQ